MRKNEIDPEKENTKTDPNLEKKENVLQAEIIVQVKIGLKIRVEVKDEELGQGKLEDFLYSI